AVPQTGHAAEHWLRVLLHAVHLLGGGAWLGALAVVVFGMPSAVRSHLLRAFAPVAASSVALVALSGVVMTLTYIGSLSNLWTTDYGRRLLLKLAVVGASLVIGGLNWRALHRGEARASGKMPTLEASLVLAIVVLTAWLTETAHP
ncbi:MAG: CopD family protein, partial [Vicinamibacterales bacterium]